MHGSSLLVTTPAGICPYLAIRRSVPCLRVRRKKQLPSPGVSYLSKQIEISHFPVSLENILFLTKENPNYSPERAALWKETYIYQQSLTDQLRANLSIYLINKGVSLQVI